MTHILIIEDDPLIAMVLQDLLEDGRARTSSVAVTEGQAVEMARSRRPDIITSDVRLLEGTGPQAVARIHETLGNIPVVFLTATPQECTPCEPPGRILGKPFDPTELTSLVRSLLAA